MAHSTRTNFFHASGNLKQQILLPPRKRIDIRTLIDPDQLHQDRPPPRSYSSRVLDRVKIKTNDKNNLAQQISGALSKKLFAQTFSSEFHKKASITTSNMNFHSARVQEGGISRGGSPEKSKRNSNKLDKLKLKQNLGRLSLLKEGAELSQGTNPLQVIFDVLGSLSRNQNFYREAFEYISETLKSETLFDREDPTIHLPCLHTVLEKQPNQTLIRAALQMSPETQPTLLSYRQICAELTSEVSRIITDYDTEIAAYKQCIESLSKTIQDKRETIIKMKNTVKYYSTHPSQDLYPYIEELQNKVAELNQTVTLEQSEHKETITNLQVMRTTNSILNQRIEELKAKIYELQIQKFNSLDKVQKNSELVNFEQHVASLKSMLDSSIVRMMGMKEEFDKLKSQNEALINQRSELAKRASVSFSELTPRPQLKAIFQEEGLNYDRIFKKSTGHQKVSTETFVKFMVSKFKDVFTSWKQMELGKKIVYDFHGNPINKYKGSNPVSSMSAQKTAREGDGGGVKNNSGTQNGTNIDPASIIEQMKQGKAKIRATQDAAFEMKNKYNKDLENRKKMPQPTKPISLV